MFVGAAIGLLASLLLPMGQRSWSYRREREQSIRHYLADLKADKDRHTQKLGLSSTQYKLQHSLTLQQYAEAMAVALDLARRETVRDVWVQRSALNQTIMLNGALMLSCAYENFSQSHLPRNIEVPMPIALLYALNASLGLAVFACTVCIVLCLKLQDRLGWYALGDPLMVYHCGKTHATFNDYFSCHCETLRSAADWVFYCGGVCVIIAAIVLQAIKFYSSHHDDAASLITLHAVFSAIGIVALPFLVWRFSVGRWISSAAPLDYGGLGGVTDDERYVLQQQEFQRKREEQLQARRELILAARQGRQSGQRGVNEPLVESMGTTFTRLDSIGNRSKSVSSYVGSGLDAAAGGNVRCVDAGAGGPSSYQHQEFIDER